MFEPQIEEVVIDPIARCVVIDKVFVKQYCQGCLYAAGTGQVVLLDELVGLGTCHAVSLGNCIQK